MRPIKVVLALILFMSITPSIAQQGGGSTSIVLGGNLTGDRSFVGYADLDIVLRNASITGRTSVTVNAYNSSRITGSIDITGSSLFLVKTGNSRTVVIENITARTTNGWGTLGISVGSCQTLVIHDMVLRNTSLLVNASGCMEVQLSNVSAGGFTASIIVRRAPVVNVSRVEASFIGIEGMHVELARVNALRIDIEAWSSAQLDRVNSRVLSVSGPSPGSHASPSPLVELYNSTSERAILLDVSEVWIDSSNMTNIAIVARRNAQVARSSLAHLTVFSQSLALAGSFIRGQMDLGAEKVLIYNSTLSGPAPLLNIVGRTGEVKIVLSTLKSKPVAGGEGYPPIISIRTIENRTNITIIGSIITLGNRTLLSTRSAGNLALNILSSNIVRAISIADARAANLSAVILASQISQSPSAGPAGGQLVGKPLFSAGQGKVLILASVLRLESPIIVSKPYKGKLNLVIARSQLDAPPGIGQQIYTSQMPGVVVKLGFGNDPCWAGNEYTYAAQILEGPGVYGVQDPAPGRGPEPGECRPSTIIAGVPVSYEEGNLSLVPRVYGIYATIYPGSASIEARLAGAPVDVEILGRTTGAQLVHAVAESVGLGRYRANMTLRAGGASFRGQLLLAAPASPAIITVDNTSIPLISIEKIVRTPLPKRVNITLAPKLVACIAFANHVSFPETWQECGKQGEELTINWASSLTGSRIWSAMLVSIEGPAGEPRHAILLAVKEQHQENLSPNLYTGTTETRAGSLGVVLAAGLAGVLLLRWAVRQG